MPYRDVIRSSDEGWIQEYYDDASKATSPVGRVNPHSYINSGDEGWQSDYRDEAGNIWDQSLYQQQAEADFNRILQEGQAAGYKDAQLVAYLDQRFRQEGIGSVGYPAIDRLIQMGAVNGNATLPSGENLYGYADRTRAAHNDRGMLGVSPMFDQFAIGAAGMLAGGYLGGAFGGEAGAATGGTGTTAAGVSGSGGPLMPAATPVTSAQAGSMGLMPAAVPTGAASFSPTGILPAGAGAGAGLGSLSTGGAELGGGYQAPSVETGTWNGGSDVMMNQNFNEPIMNVGAGGSQPIMSDFNGTSGMGSYNPRTGAPITNMGGSGGLSGGTGSNYLGMARDGLGLGMGLYGLYQADQMQGDMNALMRQAQEQQGPRYPNEMNWDLVDSYLRDPMQVLRNNPGYLASVDFVEKEARRKMAQGGYNASGNATHYMADVLGKNASKWYEQAWAPIRDAAGLMQNPDPSRLAGVQANALGQINTAKTNAIGSMAKATSDALPNIFKFALS